MSGTTTRASSAQLMVDLIISLDGYASAEGWPGWWGLEGPEYLAWLEEEGAKRYTILMGANTYRLMSGMAADAEADGSAFSREEGASLTGLAAVTKIIFSATLPAPLAWPNSELVTGDAVEAVREMKRTGTGTLSTLGSLSLSRSLLTAGLVDRFRVVVFPVITGRTGRERIYDGYPDVALEMVESRTFDGRLQLLEYVPTVLTGPPARGPGEQRTG
ncbi:dihydrofolate reductase family protein [Pseudarthrobacter sp. H3Y2-7]|uniref:dihydrofolate reductase family protein n=1 Tax=Pseudarthrobacter naphthalenicus TaxID=3031328 RepID=UPI0023AF96F6|nr:dihydrofolate reductase family protein [Pseudarthrobacter sp. H3Y2-7]MDE8670794.1 dihydrofolate reductase family protein [Pseudarthrobacter sp. H3Y2-7]